MVYCCCVIGCRNNKNKDPNVLLSFHTFPSYPAQLKRKWLRAIGRSNWEPPPHARVCSEHFSNDQINYDGCRIRLKAYASPVNFLPSNSNFEASDVEACRICLATDVKMYSLESSVLSACMETITDKNGNFNIGGLPNFVCYQCTPNLVKSSELIEKCMTSQTTLLDIFAENGQVTKSLIKEHSKSELKSTPNNSKFAKITSNFDETKSESNDSDVTYLIYKNDHDYIEMQDIEMSECETEENKVIDNNESSSLKEDVILDDDCCQDSSSNVEDAKITESLIKEHSQSELKSSPNINSIFSKITSNFNVTPSASDYSAVTHLVYQNDHDYIKIETQDIEMSKFQTEEDEYEVIVIDNNESSSVVEIVIPDDDCSQDSSSNAEDAKITESLIKEHSKSELKSSSNNNSECSKITSNFNMTKSKSNDSDVICVINQNDHDYIKTETQDIEISKCKTEEHGNEISVIDNNESSSVEVIIPDDDCSRDSRSKAQDAKETDNEVKHIKKKVPGKKTPSETDMLKYFNIVELSLQEQIREWEKSTVRRRTLKSDTVYKCEICNKTFTNASSYRVHLTYHDASHGEAECPVCKLRFRSSVVASSHTKRVHSKKFFCKACPKAFNNVCVAKKHQRWHSGYLYPCGVCGYRARHEAAASAHRRTTHAPTHTCAHCGRAFYTTRGWQIHMRTNHVNMAKTETKYRCELCGIGFTSENAQRVHVLTSIRHVKKPDLGTSQEPDRRKCCRICGKECGSYKELVLHHRTEHGRRRRPSHPWRGSAPYPISCEICGETISTRRNHWLHVRRHHPKEVDTYQPVITAVCDTCGKGYQNTTKLRLHKLRHRSPTVKCQVCPRMFYDKYALMRHARTHNADKPHQCRVCGRAFKVKSNLDRHASVHTDATPYECTMCGKKFKHSSSVNLHVRTVHYKLPPPPRKKRSKSAKDGCFVKY